MGIINDIKELYQGEGILYKHLSLACISGIVALTGDSELWKNLASQGNFIMMLICIIIAIIGSFYLFGYIIETIHYRLQAGIVVLPELTTQPFSRGLAMILIILAWGFFTSIVGAILIIPMAILMQPILVGLMCILFFIYAIFVQFVFIAYAKEFQSIGLFNITLPFKFMQIAFGDMALLSLKYFLVYICAVIPAFLIGLIINIINSSLGIAISLCLIGYISFILQIVWYNALAEIYEQKIDGMVDGLD